MSDDEAPPARAPASDAPAWHRRSAVLLTCVIVAVIVTGAALARTFEGRRVTAGLGIRTAQEPYTSVAFAQPATLGTAGVHYSGPRVTDRLGFVVTNRQHRLLRYSWTVSFLPAWHVTRGSVAVAPDRSATVTPRVVLPCNRRVGPAGSKPKRVQVRVTLIHTSDRIDFWQACGG